MKMAIPINFRENFQKSYIGRIRKNPRIHPSYHFCDFFKSDNLGLKMKFLKFLGIHPKSS